MANKVSIFIKNTAGRPIELTNSKMALMLVCDKPSINWEVVFGYKVGAYDIVLSDFSNPYSPAFGNGYCLVESCDNKEIARRIIKDCRKLLKEQYERMMMIRVAKKYELDEKTLLKIQLEYYDSKNYEIDLKKYFE